MADENGIEGVLSSIRRLVAEDGPEPSKTSPPAQGQPGNGRMRIDPPAPKMRPQADPLVLSPASSAAPKPPERPMTRDAGAFDQPIFKQTKAEKRMARRGREASHAVTRPVAEPLTLRNPVSVPGPQGAGDGPSPFAMKSEPLILSPSDVVRTGSIPLPAHDAQNAAAVPVPEELGKKVSALETAVAEMAEQSVEDQLTPVVEETIRDALEPVSSEDTAPSQQELEDRVVASEAPVTVDEFVVNTPVENPVGTAPEPMPEDDAAAMAHGARTETQPETPMSGGGGQDDAPAPTEVELSQAEPAEAETAAVEAVAASDGAAPAVAVPSEEDLRGLVRDVLRQELEGEMGERITRNLRRMIQQEIRDALKSSANT